MLWYVQRKVTALELTEINTVVKLQVESLRIDYDVLGPFGVPP